LHLWEGRPSRRERLRQERWLEFKQGIMEGMAISGFSFLLYLPQLILCILLFNKLEPALPNQYLGHFAFLSMTLPMLTTWIFTAHVWEKKSERVPDDVFPFD